MITIKMQVDEQALWEAVFGSSGFSFGDHWVQAEFLDGADWDKIGRVSITAVNADDEEVSKTIGLEDIANALPIANEQVYMDLFDFDNYDAICADAVLQVAILGEVIYG